MPSQLLDRCASDDRAAFTALQRAILLTVHYRDLFSHPLTVDELHDYLVLSSASARAIDEALDSLVPTHLSRVGRYVTWRGREALVLERRVRVAASSVLWGKARNYSRIIRRIPFIRMAGISGSLAVNNATAGRDDIDLFCITQANRVWVVMLYLKLLSLYSFRVPGQAILCPNTCLAEDQLEIGAQNLYIAHQIIHVVPLWGADVYARFLRRNAWVANFLPNAYAARMADERSGTAAGGTRWSERLIPSGIADGLNTCICHAGVRKAARFYRQTHSEAMLRAARNPQRYMLPGQGYTGAIAKRFVDGHATRFADVFSHAEMEAVFGCTADNFVDRRLDGVFRSKYERGD